MIIIKNLTNKAKSLYRCDLCDKAVKMHNRVTVYIKNGTENNPRKRCDLCVKCYKQLFSSVVQVGGDDNAI